MNDRRRVRTASAVGGGAAVTLMLGIITALIHIATLAGRKYRARRAVRQTAQED